MDQTMKASLQAKLGSLIVHIEEATSAKGHAFDWAAIKTIVEDAEVKRWLASIKPLLPVKRDA